MKVAVTGGTGYVGAFTVKALVDGGHQPRLLVRNKDRLRTNVAPLGVDIDALDVVTGDMTDASAVEHLVEGCDAAIHGAAVVGTLDRAAAERALDANVSGTELVVTSALAAGCDPVVHVSSIAAVFNPAEPLVHVDLPPAVDAASPYTRSKALADAWARNLQAQGLPVVLVYPGGVTGPAAGDAYGEVASGFVSMLKTGLLALNDGGITVIDVRDLAAVMVAVLRPGLGPRRFMVGGDLVTLPEIGAIIRRLTGRRFPVLPTPGRVFRGLGRATDSLRRLVPFDTVFTAEAMDALTLVRPADNSAVHNDLGISFRNPEETIGASLRALYEGGVLSARHVGRVAD